MEIVTGDTRTTVTVVSGRWRFNMRFRKAATPPTEQECAAIADALVAELQRALTPIPTPARRKRKASV
jgi:hypothetical protein